LGVTEPFAMARARKALAAAGFDEHVPLTRASSVTNEVWLTDEFVIRVNRRPNHRLRREAFLGPLLPSSVGYPETIAYGGELGADWLIAARLPGEMLSACWPDMNEFERRNAVRQLADMLQALHRVPVPPDLPTVDNPPQLLNPNCLPVVEPLYRALDWLERTADQTGVSTALIADARHIVLNSTGALEPFSTATLIHGDLHFQNVLWDGFSVTGLLDIEWARGAPPDLDLDVFLRFCAHPHWFVAPEYADRTRREDYTAVPYWLADFYPELFAHEYALDRTELYAIAYDVRDLVDEVKAQKIDGSPRDLPEWHPHRRLEDTIFSRSHLRRLAGQAAWDAPDFGEPMPGPPPLAPSARTA
jgi:aminoglycoside phosphotransferase (APT) family kinase protein